LVEEIGDLAGCRARVGIELERFADERGSAVQDEPAPDLLPIRVLAGELELVAGRRLAAKPAALLALEERPELLLGDERCLLDRLLALQGDEGEEDGQDRAPARGRGVDLRVEADEGGARLLDRLDQLERLASR